MTEQITEIDTLVVGAGQAGVAMSEHLTRLDIPHLVLEKQGIAQAWRSGRWDSLVANGPAWHDRFPGMVFPDCPADSFVGKEQVADYFAAYARSFKAPIRTGVEVFSAERLVGRPGFRIDTSQGVIAVWIAFAAAVLLTGWGLWPMNIDQWQKYYMLVSWLFMVSSTFTLSKTVRDAQEATLLEQRSARTRSAEEADAA